MDPGTWTLTLISTRWLTHTRATHLLTKYTDYYLLSDCLLKEFRLRADLLSGFPSLTKCTY